MFQTIFFGEIEEWSKVEHGDNVILLSIFDSVTVSAAECFQELDPSGRFQLNDGIKQQ